MTLNIRKSALTFVALATIATLAAACGSKKKDDTTPGGAVAEKGSTGTPANLACNGTNADPVSLNSNLTVVVHTVRQPISGTTFPDVGGATVAVYDVATGTTSGLAAITTSANGLGLLTLKDSKRYAFAVSKPSAGTFVPTYQFNTLTAPAGTSTSGSLINLRLIGTDVFSAFIGLLQFVPTDVAGKTEVAAAVTDCDGDVMKNIVVDAIPTCKSDTGLPCAAYFSSGTPNLNATSTDASGQFIIVGVTPGTPFTIHLKGVVTAGTDAVEVGKLTINGHADSVALGTTEPLAP